MTREYRDREAAIRACLYAPSTTVHERGLMECLLDTRNEIKVLRCALRLLRSHHCSGSCYEDGIAPFLHDDTPHDVVMETVDDALAGSRLDGDGETHG